MTEQPNDQPTDAEPVSSYEEPQDQPRRARVPTGRDAHGFHGWIEADEDAAWMWDRRRWQVIG